MWMHFTSVSADRAKCNLCKLTFSYKGGTTSNLRKHLRSRHRTIFLQIDTKLRASVQAIPSSAAMKHPITDAKAAQNAKQRNSVNSSPTAKARQFTNPSITGQREAEPPKRPILNQSISLTRHEKINQLVLDMIVMDLQSFSIINDRGFRNLLRELEPTYNLPTRATFTTSLLPQSYSNLVDKLKSVLASAEFVSLSTDSWTSIEHETFMSITAHFITCEWRFQSSMLGCLQLDPCHTDSKILSELKRVTEKWKLEEKIVTASVDNSSNIVSSVQLCGWAHLPCFAHTLNLIVQDSLGQIETIRTKVKRIVEYFHHNSKANFQFLSVQRLIFPEAQSLKLLNDSTTRSNSTFQMFGRIVEKQESVISALELLHNPVPCLQEEDWSVVKECVLILNPIEQVIQEICSDKFLTASKIILLVRGLQSALTSVRMRVITTPAINLVENIIESISNKFALVESNSTFSKSSFLDPRFKYRTFSSPGVFNAVQEIIRHELIRLLDRQMDTDANLCLGSILDLTCDESVWQDFDRTSANMTTTSSTKADAELRKYLEEALLERKNNPLEWWKGREILYPGLSQLAKKYLSVVVTSVPCEKLFSKAGQMMSERRKRIKGKHIDEVLFLHYNQEFL